MSDIAFDASGLDKLAADLGKVPFAAASLIPKAVEVTARRIKDDWNGKLYTEGHARRTGHSISYELVKGLGEVQAEIGAVKGSGRQAYITRLLEYGSVHNGPHGYGSAALDENTADFETGLQKAAADAFKAAGL